ncbi:MAG: GNAT family N-acetyltransferase [SAR324 cluster bacterium]|nr:GNAT family N-acetyltransferase [SAR324 cluster bacterium]
MSSLNVRIVNQLSADLKESWDALVGEESPFLEWDWLASLEEAGCVSAETGWAPHHILVEDDGRLVGACPLYLKGHSEGEFIFDYQWAHAAHSAQLNYYPKLLVAVPFTPAAGIRFLTLPGMDRVALIRVMGQTLITICNQNEISSVHVNFCSQDEIEALEPLGFLHRMGLQYHWENKGYSVFEDYLSEFRSKRRTKIRRERKEMAERDIRIQARSGDEIRDEHVPLMFDLYKGHVQNLYWGRLYLNLHFFELAARRFRRNLCFVMAEQEGEIIAGTFNVQKNGVFYGRYWGSFRDIKHLHFNVCYYAAIEHCIANGIQRFEPGAGGDFKQLRGFDPQPTHSMHYLSQPALRSAVRDHLEHERAHMGMAIDSLTGQSQLKSTRGEG